MNDKPQAPYRFPTPLTYLERRARRKKQEQDRQDALDAANEAIVRRAFGAVSAPECTPTALTLGGGPQTRGLRCD